MVAIKPQQVSAIVKSPDPKVQAYLLHGPDAGQVAELSLAIAKAIASRETPPGEIIRLDDADLESDPDRLAVELRTMPMFGGRKVIRASTGRRINTAMLKPLVTEGQLEGTLIVEAGNLKQGEALRTLFETPGHAAAIACYGDEGRDLDGLVRDVLKAAGFDISPEAREMLIARLGADRALSRNEIEKLALYARGRARIEADDVEAIVGDAAELALDRVVTATASGQPRRAVVECDRAVASGESPQTIILFIERHFHRLHRARAGIEAGRSMDDALRALRPPVFFKQRPQFEAQCRMWSEARLSAALTRIAKAAKAARLGGTLEGPITERLLIELAMMAKAGEGTRR